MSAASKIPPRVVGPFCPLLTTALLRLHVEHLSAKSKSKITQRHPLSIELARAQVHQRCSGQAEWTLTYLIRNALLERCSAPAGELAEVFFTLALFAQRRDLALARYCFQLSVYSALARDAKAGSRAADGKAAAKSFVAWGLFESKYGRRLLAQRLLRRAVQLDESKEPVLRWKSIF